MSGLEVVGVILGTIPIVLELFDHSDSISRSISTLSNHGFTREMSKHRSRLRTYKALFQANADQIKAVLKRHEQDIMQMLTHSPAASKTFASDDLIIEPHGFTLEELLGSCHENLTQVRKDLDALSYLLSKFVRSASFDLRTVGFMFRQRSITKSLKELQDSITTFSSLRESICTILCNLENANQPNSIHQAQSKTRSQCGPGLSEYKKIQHASFKLYETINEKWHCANHENHAFLISIKDSPQESRDESSVGLNIILSSFTKVDIQEQRLLVEVLHGKCIRTSGWQAECKDPQSLSDKNSPEWIRDFYSGLVKGSRGILPDTGSVSTGKKPRKSRQVVHLHPNAPIETLTPTEDLFQNNTNKLSEEDTIDLQLVGDFCVHFDRYKPKNGPMACLGYLQDHCVQRFYISSAAQALNHQPRTLKAIISASATSLFKTLPRAKRIELARSLAKVVLQFHETPWLPEEWNPSEICFLCTRSEVTGAVDDVGRLPYVISKFGRLRERKGKEPAHLSKSSESSTSQGQNKANLDVPAGVRNIQLFRLGIALLELGYSEPWTSLFSQAVDTLPERLKSDYYAADKLAKELARHMGVDYARVVLKCIGCDFGLGIGECDFSNELLQEKYVEDVVDKLKRMEENMNKFLVGLAH